MPVFVLFFNGPATTEIYTLSLHDALPICLAPRVNRHVARPPHRHGVEQPAVAPLVPRHHQPQPAAVAQRDERSEEHTSELQSRQYLVCRLLLEKKHKETI